MDLMDAIFKALAAPPIVHQPALSQKICPMCGATAYVPIEETECPTMWCGHNLEFAEPNLDMTEEQAEEDRL